MELFDVSGRTSVVCGMGRDYGEQPHKSGVRGRMYEIRVVVVVYDGRITQQTLMILLLIHTVFKP